MKIRVSLSYIFALLSFWGAFYRTIGPAGDGQSGFASAMNAASPHYNATISELDLERIRDETLRLYDQGVRPAVLMKIMGSLYTRNIILLESEIPEYGKVIRKYCFDLNIDGRSCGVVLRHIEAFPKNPDWESLCGGPASWCLKELFLRLPYFETFDGVLLGNVSEGYDTSDIDFLLILKYVLLDRACTHTDAASSLRERVLHQMSPSASHSWLSGSEDARGYGFRSLTGMVPCNADHWIPGRWVSVPMWSNAKSKGAALLRCPFGSVDYIDGALDSPCLEVDALRGSCHIKWPAVCRSLWSSAVAENMVIEGPSEAMDPSEASSDGYDDDDDLEYLPQSQRAAILAARDGKCLVYSFIRRINSDFDLQFELWAHNKSRCEVHVFSPDVSYRDKVSDPRFNGIQWHSICIKGSGSYGAKASSACKILSLAESIASLHHMDRTIDFLRLDTDGFDVHVIDNIVRESSAALLHVRNILMTVNLTSLYKLPEVRLLTSLTYRVLKQQGYRLWYRHELSCQGNHSMHDILLKMGFGSRVCGYEIGLHRIEDADVSVEREVGGIHALVEGLRGDGTNYRGEGEVIERVVINADAFRPSRSLSTFADVSNYVMRSQIKVAIQFPGFDTGRFFMASVAELFVDSGFDITVCADNIDGWDTPMWRFITKGWTTRAPVSACIHESYSYDLIVVFSDDAVIRSPREQSALKLIRDKVLSIQLRPTQNGGGFFGRELVLHPKVDGNSFVFPFLRISEEILTTRVYYPELQHLIASSSTVFVVPVCESWMDGCDVEYTMEDVPRLIDKCPACGIVATGSPEAVLSSLQKGNIRDTYAPRITAIGNLPLYDLIVTMMLSQCVWIPVEKNSSSSYSSVVSSLALAFSLKRVIVVPRHLSEFFGLEDAVVSYETSIAEIDFSSIDISFLLDRMNDFEVAQRVQNNVNLYNKLFPMM